jgi:uncharacterized membrane protein YiaA
MVTLVSDNTPKSTFYSIRFKVFSKTLILIGMTKFSVSVFIINKILNVPGVWD